MNHQVRRDVKLPAPAGMLAKYVQYILLYYKFLHYTLLYNTYAQCTVYRAYVLYISRAMDNYRIFIGFTIYWHTVLYPYIRVRTYLYLTSYRVYRYLTIFTLIWFYSLNLHWAFLLFIYLFLAGHFSRHTILYCIQCLADARTIHVRSTISYKISFYCT